MIEHQETIVKWATDTFGEVTLSRAFGRMQEEYWELREVMHHLDYGDGDPEKLKAKARIECADLLITLYRVAHKLEIYLPDEVNKKMSINRARKWNVDAHGTGQHVEGT